MTQHKFFIIILSLVSFCVKSQVFQLSSSFSDARYAHCTAQSPNNNVLIFGGRIGTGSNINSVYEYNTSNNTWASKASIPDANGLGNSASVKLIDGSIYLFGGSLNGSTAQSNKAYRYKYSTDSWTILNNLPNAVGREQMSATLINDTTVLLCGGLTSNVSGLIYQSACYLYHTQIDSYSLAGNLAHGVIDHTATLMQNGEVLISGGFDGNAARSEVYVYNRQNGLRTLTTSLTTAVSAHSALELNGKVYIYGGFNIPNFEYSNILDVYNPTTDQVQLLNTGPVGTSSFSMIAFDSLLLIAGGNKLLPSGAFGVTDETNVYNTLTNSFSSFDSLPTIRAQMKISPIGNTGKYLLSGGAISLSQPYDNAIIFDPGQVISGQRSILVANDFEIFPNPVNDKLFIDLNQFQSELNRISIFSLIGEKIFEVNSSNALVEIDLNHLSSGNYIVAVTNSKSSLSKIFKVKN